MKNGKLVFSLLLVFFSIGMVSAFWPFNSITGNVVDGTTVADTNKCMDLDGGVNSSVAGAVIITSWTRSATGDSCSGTSKLMYDSSGKSFKAYPSITETYCGDDEKKKTEKFNSTHLGSGYCVAESVEFDGKVIKSAKWVSDSDVCIVVNSKVVKDKFGKAYTSSCGTGANKSIFNNYSCDGGKVKLVSQNCSLLGSQGRCGASGCYGSAVDTDEANDINVAGVLTLDGVNYPDECNSKATAVRQYKVVNGVKKVVMNGESDWKACGTNRECVVNSTNGAGYCRDAFAGAETIATLNEKIAGLNALIQSLTERVDALESADEESEEVEE